MGEVLGSKVLEDVQTCKMHRNDKQGSTGKESCERSQGEVGFLGRQLSARGGGDHGGGEDRIQRRPVGGAAGSKGSLLDQLGAAPEGSMVFLDSVLGKSCSGSVFLAWWSPGCIRELV